jgi:putative glutamine amidotransferase
MASPAHSALGAGARFRPVIGITTYVAAARWGPWDLPAALVPLGYASAVSAAGGHPILLPPAPGRHEETLAIVDGLIFCGGPDLDPALYGQPRSGDTVHLAPERDAPELELMLAALERDVPVFGICRGMQVLNVARGGSLIQHLPAVVGHDGHATAPGHFDLHSVAIASGSRIGEILGHDAVVHSGHHQGVDDLGEGLVATAWAPDGTIEAIEIGDHRFVIGALWHPEQGDDQRLFAAMVEASRRAPAAT